MKRPTLFFTVALVPLDFLMLFSAGIAAYFLRTSNIITSVRPVLFYIELPLERFVFMLLAIIPLWLMVFALTGLYNIQRKSMLEEFFQIIASVSFAMMSVIIYIFVQLEFFNSRFIVLAAWVFAIVFVWLGRWLLRFVQRYFMVTRRLGLQRVLIIGDDDASRMLDNQMRQDLALGYMPVKKIKNLDIVEVKKAILNPKIDTVIVAKADYSKDAVVELAEFCQENHLNFQFVPTLFQTFTTNTHIDFIGGVPLLAVQNTPLAGWGSVLKRSMDIFGSLVGLIFLAPFFGIIAFLIKINSKGSVFVALDRITQGKTFQLYKFRSMVEGAHLLKSKLMLRNEREQAGPLFKMRNDPRITSIGRILRRTRIDEFPQLFNVLKGEMSLIGPRPHEPAEVAKYAKHHKKLLTIKAGMTGMAQISGSSDLPFEEEVKLDVYYIENWSFLLDIKILLRTFTVLLRDRSAC